MLQFRILGKSCCICWNTFTTKYHHSYYYCIVAIILQPACPAVYEMLTTLLEWVCETSLCQTSSESSPHVQDRCLKVDFLLLSFSNCKMTFYNWLFSNLFHCFCLTCTIKSLKLRLYKPVKIYFYHWHVSFKANIKNSCSGYFYTIFHTCSWCSIFYSTLLCWWRCKCGEINDLWCYVIHCDQGAHYKGRNRMKLFKSCHSQSPIIYTRI